jgi:hypothetical protein
LQHLAPLIERGRRAGRAVGGLGLALADGMSRGLLGRWQDRDHINDTTLLATKSLAHIVPAGLLQDCWAQLLGSHRDALERNLVSKFKDDIDKLREAILLDHESKDRWIEHLTAFIAPVAGERERRPSAKSSDRVVEHCLSAAMTFRPWRPDATYWPELQSLVKSAVSVLPHEEQPLAVADAWIRIHMGVESLVRQRLLPVMMARFHRLKNEINRDKPGSPAHWLDRFNLITARAVEFLELHRWPTLEPIDLRDVICAAVYHPPFAPIGSAKRADTRIWPIRPDHPVAVLGDQALLTEVVTELLRNALKAHSSTISGWTVVQLSELDDEAVVTVRDDAGGCAPRVLDGLNATYESPAGAQLGMGFGHMFCKRIVALHDGSLTFSFSPASDVGLVAELRLPIWRGETLADNAQTDISTNGGFLPTCAAFPGFELTL